MAPSLGGRVGPGAPEPPCLDLVQSRNGTGHYHGHECDRDHGALAGPDAVIDDYRALDDLIDNHGGAVSRRGLVPSHAPTRGDAARGRAGGGGWTPGDGHFPVSDAILASVKVGTRPFLTAGEVAPGATLHGYPLTFVADQGTSSSTLQYTSSDSETDGMSYAVHIQP